MSDDPVGDRLREAVWADPDSDDPRMVYADHLQQRGDPMGELIALQLERARTGAVMSDRELELHQAIGRQTGGPLAPYLSLFGLERGFVSSAMPVPTLPPEIAHHPAWSTVNRIEIESKAGALLTNPHLRARRLGAYETALLELSYGTQPLPFTSLAGINPHWGLSFTPQQRHVFEHLGAFDHVRALSLNARGLEELDQEVLESRLCTQLDHLDVAFTSVRLDDLHMWLIWFATSKLQRITFQVPLGAVDPGQRRRSPYPSAATHYTCFLIDRSLDRLILQLSEPTEPNHLDGLLRAASVLGADKASIEVHDVGDSNQLATRQALALAGLRELFDEVRQVTGPVRSLVL